MNIRLAPIITVSNFEAFAINSRRQIMGLYGIEKPELGFCYYLFFSFFLANCLGSGGAGFCRISSRINDYHSRNDTRTSPNISKP